MLNFNRANSELLPEKGAHIHFIGIGGSSMNGLALMTQHAGYKVTGSDRDESVTILMLRSKGIDVMIGQRAGNISPDIALVIYTVAIDPQNPELVAAKELGLKIIERGSFLGLISGLYKYTLSVTGTHGKTTTTAMLSSILLSGKLDPAIHLGGVFPLIKGSVRPSDSDYFVTEACEYHAHMLAIKTYAGIILNVESEHLDFYITDENIDAAFAEFAARICEDGFLVVCAENARAVKAARAAHCRVVSYALADSNFHADYTAQNIRITAKYTEYTLCRAGEALGKLRVNVPGRHNILNSLAAAAAALELGLNFASVKAGLKAFNGTGRRFEKVREVRGATLIDDYAHHPTEVAATLDAARTLADGKGRILAVFQVHTFTRALDFGHQFAEALLNADNVVVTDIYAAREPDPGNVSGETLTELFLKTGVNARFIRGFAEIAEYISSIIEPGDIVLTLGAGDVNKVLPLIV